MIKKGFGGMIVELMNRPNIKNLFSKVGDIKSGKSSAFGGQDITGFTKKAKYDPDDVGGFQKTTKQQIVKAKNGLLIKGKPKLTKKGWR
jgi:hypothetical protein